MTSAVQVLPRSTEARGRVPKGHWHIRLVKGNEISGLSPDRKHAAISCPLCEKVGLLTDDYSIADDGTVTPEYKCEFRCGFRGAIRLEDWKP